MDVKTIMVIGSGLMGGGIAQVAAQAGYEVIMNDLNMELIEQGFSTTPPGKRKPGRISISDGKGLRKGENQER